MQSYEVPLSVTTASGRQTVLARVRASDWASAQGQALGETRSSGVYSSVELFIQTEPATSSAARISIHEYNNRKADIQRHAEAALDGLRRRAVEEKLSTEVIIARAYAIGAAQERDMAQLSQLQVFFNGSTEATEKPPAIPRSDPA